jgi:ABC-type sugar transport system ATPase subunit
VIEVRSLSFSINQKEIIKDVSFSIKKGDKIAIVGKSGAGKSSLLKLIAGILHPTSGSIHFEGKQVKSNLEKLLPGIQEIQLVSQDFGLEIYHTVLQNIENKVGHLRETIKKRFIKELVNLLELTHIINQQVVNISGGEQQRLSIARALAGESKVILFDEPFVHLDVHIKIKLLSYLKKLQTLRNTTYILVTHDGKEAFGFCDKAIYLSSGKVARFTSLVNFYNNPRSKQEALFFGDINCLKSNGKLLLFRPNAYSVVDDKANAYALKLVDQQSFGSTFLSTFTLEDQQQVQLVSIQPLPSEIFVLFHCEVEQNH